MFARTLLIAGLATSLSACGLFERKVELIVTDTGCLVFAPIRLTKAEVSMLSDESARQILTHNVTGEQRCGWGR